MKPGNRIRHIAASVCILAALAAAALPAPPAAVTDAAGVAFARQLQQSIRQGESGFLEENFDAAAFVERMFAGRKLPPEIIAEQKKLFAGEPPLGNALAETVKQGGKLKFVRLHRQGEEARILFRLLVPGGFNHYDFVLGARDGKVTIEDVYIFSAGELLSASTLRESLPALGRHNQRVAKTFSPAEADYLEYWPQVRAIRSAMRRHDPERALTLYRRLPRTVQRQRNVAVLRVYAGVAQGWNSAECARAIAHLKTYFPDSPALQMFLFQYHNERKEYQEMHAVVAALKEATGDTAYAEYLCGNVFHMQKNVVAARAAFAAALAVEPDFDDACAALVALALERKEWQEVTRWLTRLRELGIEFGDLEKAPMYAEYVKTPEYAEWKSSSPAN